MEEWMKGWRDEWLDRYADKRIEGHSSLEEALGGRLGVNKTSQAGSQNWESAAAVRKTYRVA